MESGWSKDSPPLHVRLVGLLYSFGADHDKFGGIGYGEVFFSREEGPGILVRPKADVMNEPLSATLRVPLVQIRCLKEEQFVVEPIMNSSVVKQFD